MPAVERELTGPRVPAPVDGWARAHGIAPHQRPEAVAYLRVSTAEQGAGGLGLDAQAAAVLAEAQRRGLHIVDTLIDAGVSASRESRPALDAALTAVEAAPGRTLMVAKLDRLARSLSHYSALVERSRRNRWTLLALDTPDATTPQGEAMQAVTAVFAQLERRLIGQRTREALAAARARGVQLGRPQRANTAAAEARILDMRRRRRLSASAIARELTAAGVPGPQGGPWYAPAVVRVLKGAGVTLKRGRPPVRRRPAPRPTTQTHNSRPATL